MAKVFLILAAPLVLYLLSIELPSVSGLPVAINGQHYQHHQINQHIPVGRTSFKIGKNIYFNSLQNFSAH
jgi:hypothetical protein